MRGAQPPRQAGGGGPGGGEQRRQHGVEGEHPSASRLRDEVSQEGLLGRGEGPGLPASDIAPASPDTCHRAHDHQGGKEARGGEERAPDDHKDRERYQEGLAAEAVGKDADGGGETGAHEK